MHNKRVKKHSEYFRIPGYQRIRDVRNEYIASQLGVTVRTYLNKIQGWGDFRPLEMQKLSDILEVPQEILFFTRDCIEVDTP